MRNKISNILILIMLIVVAILLLKTCEMQRDNERLIEQVASYKLGEKAFKKKLLEDSSTLASQTQTILTQDEAIKLGILKLEGDIKKVQSQVRQKQEVRIDSVPMAFIPDGYADTTLWIAKLKNGENNKEICDSLIANSIIVPKKFQSEQKWFKLYGKVNKEGVLMDSIRISNESSVTIGWKKSGFLNLKREPIVEIKNTNPYLDVTKMDNVVIKPKSGLFSKKSFWVGVGIISGFYLKTKL